MVSRRRLVALVAGTAAAGAAPAIASTYELSAAAHHASPADTGHTRRRVLADLIRVRKARGTAARSEAFASLAASLRLHDGAGSALGDAAALYRGRDASSALAQVIVRELQARPVVDAAWMTRFGDLEAVIHAQPD